MGKHALIAVGISILLSAAAVGVVIRRSGSAMQAQQRPDIRSDTLRSQAEKNGSATATARPTNLRRYDTVDALAHDSKAIIVGRVDTKTSQLLPPAEKLVVTDFQITVQDAMKGVLAPGQSIRVRTPGGRVDLGNGKYAEVKMPDFWKSPEVGKLYVLFLEARNDGSFVLRGGPQGLFEVTPARTIKAQVRPEDKLMQNYNDKSLVSFLDEIRRSSK
jgi:dUTPase